MGAEGFEFGGVHHVALVSSDMARTVDFYTNVLGMPLIKTLDLPSGGQHFFFDCGNEPPVDQQASGCVTVVSVNSQDSRHARAIVVVFLGDGQYCAARGVNES